MNALHSALHRVIEAEAAAWLNQIAITSVVLLIALAICRRAKQLSAGTRFILLSIALGAVAVPPQMVESAWNAFRGILSPPAQLVIALSMTSAVSPAAVARATMSETLCIVVIGSLLVSLLLLLAVFFDYVSIVRRFDRASRPLPERVSLIARRRASARRLHVQLSSGGVETPSVIGFIRPTLLLPHYLDALDDDAIEALVEHELEHVARRDNLLALLSALMRALFWFHPLVWLANSELRRLRESACDEAVLMKGVSVETYCGALLAACRAAPPRQPQLAACASGTNMSERIGHMENVTSFVDAGWRRVALLLCAVVISLAALAIPVAAEDVQQVSPSRIFAIDLLEETSDTVKFQLRVFAPASEQGRLMMAPIITTRFGQEASATSGYEDAKGSTWQTRVTVTPHADGTVEASYSLTRDGQPVARGTESTTLSELRSGVTRQASPAEPIDLNLKDADVRDVLRVFAKLSGREIIVDASVSGRVTANLDDVPWTEALEQIVAQVNARAVYDGNSIRIESR